MTVGISNSAVADLLERHGRLLEIAGESPFRTRAFTRAAESIRLYPERVAEVAAEGRLREIPGIGEGISAAIIQILETGSFDAHSQLTDRIPESLVELMAIPGVGAKTALRLYSDLGVDSLAALEAALVSGSSAGGQGTGRSRRSDHAGRHRGRAKAIWTHTARHRVAGSSSVHGGAFGSSTAMTP